MIFNIFTRTGGNNGIVPSDRAPLIAGTSNAGSSNLYSRNDHIHPTEISRASLCSPVLTGTPTANTPYYDSSNSDFLHAYYHNKVFDECTYNELGDNSIATTAWVEARLADFFRQLNPSQ